MIASVDLSTRRKRRYAVSLAITLFERIRAAEAAYMERIPPNLHNSDAYDTTDFVLTSLDEVIDSINSVYD